MSAKEPLGYLFWPVIEAEEPLPEQPRPRQKRSVSRLVMILFNGLLLLLLLLLLVFECFLYRRSASPPAPVSPIVDVAMIAAPGFDTCVAPPADLLQTWWKSSPYRWLNVYLGGADMFPTCGGVNLIPAWVKAVYQQGWSMLPTWVGLQAPCAQQRAVMSADATVSYTQGVAQADAAIKVASSLGFSNTAPIYFDMEYFQATMPNGARNTACIQAVNAFLNGWESELTLHDHYAGVYTSASNYPVLNTSGLTVPAVAWIAGGGLWSENFNSACTVYGNKYVANSAWPDRPWIYQYTGGHNETYGQATWNIDSDCADAPMVGHVTTAPLALPFQHS